MPELLQSRFVANAGKVTPAAFSFSTVVTDVETAVNVLAQIMGLLLPILAKAGIPVGTLALMHETIPTSTVNSTSV